MEETEKKITSESKTVSMPSVDALFSESWDTFKKSVLSLFVFSLVTFAIAFVVLIIAFAVIFLSSAGALAAGDQQNYSLTGALAIFGVFGFIGLCFGFFVLLLAYNIGTVLIVHAKGNISLGQTLQKSIALLLPVLLIAILAMFFVLGGYFLFIIPGLVLALFFLFSNYEVVLDNKRGLAAMRSSVSIVSQHFWEILGRFLLLFLVNFLIGMVLGFVGFFADNNSATSLLFSLINIVVNILISWFGSAYFLVLYQHAKASAHADKPGSLLWPTIIAGIGWVIGIFVIIALVAIVSTKEFQEGFQKGLKGEGNTTQSSSDASRMVTQQEADNLAYDTFLLANEYRKENKLPVLQSDNRLCAYAQRRLEQLTTLGRYDDSKGYYEDLANPQIGNAYFNPGALINQEAWDSITAATTPDQIVAAWTKREKGKGILPNAEYIKGCIRGSGKFLVFIATSK